MALLCERITYGVVIALLASVCRINCETYSSAESQDKLGIAYEFKIHVEAGREDCYYQYVHQSASLYVAFQVMRGGDGQAGFAIRNPNGQFVMPYTWKPNAEHDESSVQNSGYYAMCIDNSLSRFAAKLVSLYVASFKRDEWDKYISEMSEHEVTVGNFSVALQNVDKNIGSIIKSLDHSRRLNSADWYIVDSNNKYVQNWSIAQCVVIIISSVVQVFFVKKLFSAGNSVRGKPRA